MSIKNKPAVRRQRLRSDRGLAPHPIVFLLTLFLGWLGGAGMVGSALAETCVPVGSGGAYSGLSGGAPKFWDVPHNFPTCNADDFNRFNKWIDDPRWDGATSTTHGAGTTDIMQFRAVQRPVAGQNYLFLSWWVKNTADLANPSNNQLYVGFRPDDTTSPGVVLKVFMQQASDATGESAVQGAADTLLYVMSSESLPTGSSGGVYQGTSGAQALPSWARDARVWIDKSRVTPGASGCASGPAVVWAVHLRVPLQAEISPDPAHSVILGNTADRKFRLWYTTRIDTAAGLVPLTWPRTTNPAACDPDNFDLQACSPDFLESTPSFSVWPAFYLSTGSSDLTASCQAGGITIQSSDISVNYPGSPSDWRIGIPVSSGAAQPVNTFHAKPTNKSGQAINRNDLHARFSMANWGSQVQDGEADPGTGEWKEIPGLGDVTDTGATGTADPVANGVRWDINQTKQFTFAEFVGKSAHQCIQVELFGAGGLSFLKSSAFRNMRTVRTSTFREDAEIALTGLKGGSVRDVFLHVEPHNMPAEESGSYRVTTAAPPVTRSQSQGTSLAAASVDSQDKAPTEVAEASISQTEYESRVASEPSYILRAFYDTGRKISINGLDRRVLQPMVSFGYFAHHEGALKGWQHELEGATKVAGTDDWYQLRVNGKATITNTIEAVEKFGDGELEWWQWLLLILLVLIILLLLWRRP